MLCFRLDPIALPTFSFHFWCRLALQWYFQITMPTENISNCVFCVILYCQKSFRKFLIETQRTYYIAFKTLPPPTLYIQSESYIVKVLVCNVSVFQCFSISIFQYFSMSVFQYLSVSLFQYLMGEQPGAWGGAPKSIEARFRVRLWRISLTQSSSCIS